MVPMMIYEKKKSKAEEKIAFEDSQKRFQTIKTEKVKN